MSITNELRKWNDETTILPITRRQLLDAIADRIDEKHYDVQADAYDNGANYVFNNPTLFWLMPLPKDADGKYIRVGDELDGYGFPNGGVYCKAIVNETMILVGSKDCSYRAWLMWDATEVRHHHEPTIEDVLREFGEMYCGVYEGSDGETELIAEYAAKLQLRSDEE